MAKKLWYAEQLKIDNITKKLGFSRINIYQEQIDKNKQRKKNPKRQLGQFLKKRIKPKYTTRRLDNINYELKANKIGRIIASIMLPIIMFIGIGMTIGAFKSKVIVEGNTEYMYTPFDKGIGLLNIVSKSGQRYKKAIDKANEWAQEVDQYEAHEEIWYNPSTGESGTISGNISVKKNGSTTITIYRALNIIWYVVKEPILLTYDLANYLINDI